MSDTCQPFRLLARTSSMLLLTLISTTCLAQTEKLSLVTTARPPLSANGNQPGFLDLLAGALFKRIGIEGKLTLVPAERALINVNSGIDDGDIFRIASAGQNYPNLVRVPEVVLTSDFIAYTKSPGIQIRDWSDLKPYTVAYPIGWKIYEANVRDVKGVTLTPSINELFPLLDKGRVDVILLDRWSGQWLVRQNGLALQPMEPPLASVDMFMFLNKKHAALVPKISQALRDMKKDGSYKRIYEATIMSLDKR